MLAWVLTFGQTKTIVDLQHLAHHQNVIICSLAHYQYFLKIELLPLKTFLRFFVVVFFLTIKLTATVTSPPPLAEGIIGTLREFMNVCCIIPTINIAL